MCEGFVSTPHTATPETLPAVTVLKAAFKAALKSDSKASCCSPRIAVPMGLGIRKRDHPSIIIRYGNVCKCTEISCFIVL